MAEQMPQHVHLVGSIALDTVEEVFRTAGTVARTAPEALPRWRARRTAAVDFLAISAASGECLFADGY